MLRRLYDWTMRFSASRHAPLALVCIAFAESSFFPVPPDVLMAPMVLARPERAWRYAGICAAGSVIGGLAGYAIGYSLSDLAHSLLRSLGHPGAQAAFARLFSRYGVWVILIQGLLPVPYKLLTISSGLAHFPLWKLVAASIVARSTRFFGVAALVKRFGPAALPAIERRLALVGALIVAIAVVVVVAVKLLP
jgi:membrane protein YqaA with SNARE-associated domain